MLVFSLGCEKSDSRINEKSVFSFRYEKCNSRIYENCHIRWEKHTISNCHENDFSQHNVVKAVSCHGICHLECLHFSFHPLMTATFGHISNSLFGTEHSPSFEMFHILSVWQRFSTMIDVRNYLSVCIGTPWAGILPNRLVLLPGDEKSTNFYVVEELLLGGRWLKCVFLFFWNWNQKWCQVPSLISCLVFFIKVSQVCVPVWSLHGHNCYP